MGFKKSVFILTVNTNLTHQNLQTLMFILLVGQPEDHECSVPGSRDNCPGGEEALCCFNGCLNVCLTEPPYTVQRAYFDREKGIIVSDAGGLGSTGGDGGEGDGDYEDEDFFSGAINPRSGAQTPSSPTEARA